MSLSRKRKIIYWTVFIFLIILILFLSSIFVKYFFIDVQKIRTLVSSFGIWSPIIFILLHILQVLIAPIPGQLVGFAGGYLFGAWLGTLYSIIGTVLGTLLVVSLVRKFGEPFVKKMVGEKIYSKFNKFCEKEGKLTLFLIYLLPFFPDDAISFIASLSKIRMKHILLLAFIGRLPGMFGLSLIGAGVAESEVTISVVIVSILIFISFMIYLYKNKLQHKMEKLLDKIKK